MENLCIEISLEGRISVSKVWSLLDTRNSKGHVILGQGF